jgi:hypothetical protein
VSVTFDLGGAPDAFVRELEKYRNARALENSQAVNRAGSQVAFRAIGNTLKADRSAIKSKLQYLDSITFVGKGTKRRRLLKASRRVENYKATAAGRAALAGKMTLGKIFYKGFPSGPLSPKNFSGEQFRLMADAYAKKRVASAGMFAAGWLWAGRKLREAYDAAGGKDFGKFTIRQGMLGRKRGGVGEGVPASPGLHATATLINRSVNPRDPSSATAAQRIIPPGVLLAFQDVAEDMRDYITKQMKSAAERMAAAQSSNRRF